MNNDSKTLLDEEVSKAAGGNKPKSPDYEEAYKAIYKHVNEGDSINGVRKVLLNYILSEEEKEELLEKAQMMIDARKQ